MAYPTQGDMIREGTGHALAVPDTRNGTARSEMGMKMKMIVSPSCPRWGPGRRYVFTGLGRGVFVGQDPLPTPPGPLHLT